MKIKIYFPKNIYFKKYRKHLFPLLKPFLKNDLFTDDERIKMYHVSSSDFELTDTITNAEIVILPMSWNFYLKRKLKKEVLNFIDIANKHNKEVWSFTSGDFGVEIPKHKNLKVFRTSGERAKLPDTHKGFPVFIEDPLKKYYNVEDVINRNYLNKPVIGFCGQSNYSITNTIREITKVIFRNLKYYLKIQLDLPQKIQSTSYLRSQVLSRIKISKHITSNFIERKKYRAGVITKEQRIDTTKEFYQNMIESDYIICVRGAGNFSVRLYETLAMGRIPVFINTDCLMPLPKIINWKKQMVWVDVNELDKIEEKVLDFHNKHSINSFKKLQKANRLLWKEKLTLGGYFKTQIIENK